MLFTRTERNSGHRNRWRIPALVGVLIATHATAASVDDSKLHPVIDRLAAASPYGEVSLIVSFRSTPNAGHEQMLADLDGTSIVKLASIDAYALKLAAVDALLLGNAPEVEYVTVDAPVRSSSGSPAQGSTSPGIVGNDVGPTGRGVTVAVFDSGIADHPDLAGRVIASVDLLGAGGGDPFGHGTHVAGIIAGSGAASDGRFAGIAPGSDLVSVRVLDEFGAGTTSGVIRGIEWVLVHRDRFGIRIVNLSLGHAIYESADRDPLVRAVERATEAGLVVVISAGNHGHDGNFTITSPGNAPNAVTVGSSTDGDSAMAHVGSSTDGDSAMAHVGSSTDGDHAASRAASFSSLGPTAIDRVLKPDLVAPGQRIVSLRSAGSAIDQEFPGRRVSADGGPNPAYFEMSGTSIAAPMVAASVALMLEADPSLSPSSIKARLMLSADREIAGSPFAVGAGVLDPAGALAERTVATRATSPRVHADGTCCDLIVDDPSGPWVVTEIPGDAALWQDALASDDPAVQRAADSWNVLEHWSDALAQID